MILMKPPWCFRAGRQRDVLAVEQMIVEDDLAPVLLPLVLAEHVGQLRVRLVRRNEWVGFDRHRHPDVHHAAAAAAAPLSSAAAGTSLWLLAVQVCLRAHECREQAEGRRHAANASK